MTRLLRIEDPEDLARCLPVLRQLRPRLSRASERARLRRQLRAGYRLAALEVDGEIQAVTGYHLLENLAWGKFLYVDDLVVHDTVRNSGLGRRLLQWLLREARRLGCDQLHLDSGVQRHQAHAFYLKHRLQITCHHFAIPLG